MNLKNHIPVGSLWAPVLDGEFIGKKHKNQLTLRHVITMYARDKLGHITLTCYANGLVDVKFLVIDHKDLFIWCDSELTLESVLESNTYIECVATGDNHSRTVFINSRRFDVTSTIYSTGALLSRIV